MEEKILSWGKECLSIESEALRFASEKLEDKNFASAITAVLNTNGRLAVTGLGKSGHVGRKISSSLASTGTSSFFLHPSEALHGDLGMLNENDILLAIAFGGETSEVLSVVSYAKRLNMKIIAITGKLDSTLASLSDFVLDGSVEKEACPNNLAPTSSSTLALALGDAIMVSLMKARGFQREDFAQFHPGGSLGKALARVRDYMVGMEEVKFISPSSSFSEITSGLSSNNLGIVGVKDENGTFSGCITDGDIRRAFIEHDSDCFKLKGRVFFIKK